MSKRKVFSVFMILVVSLGVISAALGIVVFAAYQTIPNIDNIDGCFKTSMYNVDLCPKNAGYVRYNSLPKHLVASLIASEDGSFYVHQGFDFEEMKNAFEKSMDAGRWVRGGSTITQQLAKNLYLSKEKSLVRKAKELILARNIEKTLSKSKIIEKYFNVVEFGPNIFGISKAAHYYFGKSASQLTPAEGAYLVSLLPSPVRYSAAFRRNKELSKFNRRRVTHILRMLNVQKKISEDDYAYETARAESGLWQPMVDNIEEPTTGDVQSLFPDDGSGEEPTAEEEEYPPED